MGVYAHICMYVYVCMCVCVSCECTDVSVVVPVANSLTFLFTTLTGAALGEPIGGVGMCCIYLSLLNSLSLELSLS
jgi:Putative transmembrane family 234